VRERKFDLVACPSCGRAEVDVYALANAVEERVKDIDVPMRVAVMGCIVNGPGEAREADVGVAAGKGKGQIFVRGEVVRTVPEEAIVEEIVAEAHKLAAELAAAGTAPGAPAVITTGGAAPVLQVGRKPGA